MLRERERERGGTVKCFSFFVCERFLRDFERCQLQHTTQHNSQLTHQNSPFDHTLSIDGWSSGSFGVGYGQRKSCGAQVQREQVRKGSFGDVRKDWLQKNHTWTVSCGRSERSCDHDSVRWRRRSSFT